MDDSILQEIFSTRDPADKSALVAEYFFNGVSQEVALAARRCVILHWFNLTVVEAILRDTALTESEVRTVYEQLLTLPFIETVAWGRKFQDLTREGLLKRYARVQPEMLQTAARLAAPAYERDDENKEVAAEAFYCYIVAGDQHSSRRALNKLLGQISTYKDWHYMGNLLQLQDEAEHLPFVQSVALTEQDWILRGLVHSRQGKQETAIIDYSQAISLNAKSALAYNNRGTIYTQQQDYEKALVDFNHAFELDPANVQVYINRGIIYLRQHQYQEAEKDFRRAVQLDPANNKADGYYALALVGLFHAIATSANPLEYDALRYFYREVIPLLQQVLAIQGKNLNPEYLELANIFSTLAIRYSNLSQYDNAESFLRQALAIREKMLGLEHLEVATSLAQLAQIYVVERKYEQAEPLLRRVLMIRQQMLGPTSLRFPKPAVVIDIRHRDDSQLLQYLTVELEGLATEMYLNQMGPWRYLAECIDFLKLTIPGPDPIPNASSEFIVTTRVGKSMPFLGILELITFIGRDYLDRVRNNRIAALRDLNITGMPGRSYHDATVRVIFLTDEESLSEAATYAAWLKERYSSMWPSDLRYFTRDKPVETVAVCVHTALHHRYNLLANFEARAALDTVLFMQTHPDDEAYINEEDQIYQAELLLYTLLLHWPENFEKTIGVLDEIRAPSQTYIVGISAIEYSARWGRRWLTYGLVAKSIETLRDSSEVQQEEKLLQVEVERWLNDWWQRLRTAMPAILPLVIPDLQVLEVLQRLLHSSPFQESHLSSLLENLEAFCLQVNEFYNSSALEQALENISDVLSPLQKINVQVTAEGDNARSDLGEPFRKLVGFRVEAELFLTTLFQNARGAIPRAHAQLSALAKSIGIIQAVQQLSPDLKEGHAHFEQRTEQARQRLSYKLKQRRWWSSARDNKVLQRECENINQELSLTVQADLTKIYSFIAANVALKLLQWADLYDPSGKTCPYQQRMSYLDQVLDTAQKYAVREQQIAYQFLKPATEKVEGTIQQTLTLNSRIEFLQWDRITDAFVQSVNRLRSGSVSLNLLAESTLRYMGTERQLINEQIWQHEPDQTSDQDEEHFQSLSTILISTLLSAQVRRIDLRDVLSLLNQYIQSEKYYWQESSAFPSSISSLESLVGETVVKQATLNSITTPSTADLGPNVERILALWIEQQLRGDTSLAEVLEPHNIIDRLKERKIDFFQAIDTLRPQTVVLGYSDEMIGDKRSYLFCAPSADNDDFFETFDAIKTAQIHPIYFPDVEKLIYLYTHQIGIGVVSGANIPCA